MAICPYCKTRINSVHVTTKDISIAHYEVSVGEKFISEWHETSRDIDAQELCEIRCPRCQRRLPISSVEEINEFLAGEIVLALESEVKHKGSIVEFDGVGYEIYRDASDCLLLRPCSWTYNFFLQLFRF